MSRYRLIKLYPSLPIDWEVGMEVGIGDGRIAFSPCSSKYTDKCVNGYEVTKFPEFWNEVVLDKTYDGVELNIGDKFYVVNTCDFTLSDNGNAHTYDKACDSERAKRYGGYLWFSTKEAAYQYINENKKIFSKSDMLTFAKYVSDKYLGRICTTYLLDMEYEEFLNSVTK